MNRIKIELPDTLLHTTKIRVRITDINYGNHTGNDSIVGIMHDVRADWLRKHGFTELDVDGRGLIMADLSISFKGESFFGDQLEVRLYIDKESISRVPFDLYYSILKINASPTQEIARGKTGMVCFDYTLRKPVALPENLLRLLKD